METTTEWGDLCIRLLQGPLFRDEQEETFAQLVTWQRAVNEYFSVIGLTLHLDLDDGYAFLIQNEDAEGNTIGVSLRLLRRFPLTYEQSLLLVLLRTELDKFELSESSDHALIMSESDIADLLEPYYPGNTDKVKFADMVTNLLSSLIQMRFIKPIGQNETDTLEETGEREYEIRTIVRAKIDSAFLAEFKARLEEIKEQRNGSN